MSNPNGPYGSYSHNPYHTDPNINNDYHNAPYYDTPQPFMASRGPLYHQPSHSTSQQSVYQASEYASSVYALNTTGTDGYHDNPTTTGAGSGGMAMSPLGSSRDRDIEEEKRNLYESPRSKSNKRKYLVSAFAFLVLALAITSFCVYWFVFRNKTGSGSTASQQEKGKSLAVTGGDSSKVMLENGTEIQYSNPHGGHWYYDVNDPFNNGAKAQSWSPGLNETFNYGLDRIRGVNLGGWLVLEPFISPAPFQKYQESDPSAVDEWTLHLAMANDTANGGLDQIEEHYKTFITEQDIMEIAAAGLNYVRISLPYWAIETRTGEPYLQKVAWKYFLKAIAWCRKYGIRINLDLHTVPGSQNGWNHSGRLGSASFLQGPMGYANAQRTLDYIRILAEFAAQPQYRDVIPVVGIINEPRCDLMGKDSLSSFYAEAYRIIREVGGPQLISIHDCMLGKDAWKDFLPNADRLVLDTHPYIAFGNQDADGWAKKTPAVCQWGTEFNNSQTDFGLNLGGEFSLAINDCGLYVNGVVEGVRYEGQYIDPSFKRVGSCDQWTNYENYSDQTKSEMKSFMLGSMDALQNYFFWTWKIGPSLTSGKIESPAWSYQLGLQNGWMPTDPRAAAGACGNVSPWIPPLKNGNGDVDLAAYPWPPVSIQSAGSPSTLPSYKPTGALVTLPGGTLTVSGVKPTKDVDVGSGWANSNDKQGMAVEDPDCHYLDAWIGPNAAPPNPLCGTGAPVGLAATAKAKTTATSTRAQAVVTNTLTTAKGAIAGPKAGTGVVGGADDDDLRRRAPRPTITAAP